MEPAIKIENVEMKKSAEEYITEYLKCKNSFDYFCPKYVLLETTGGDTHFIPYEKQSELIRTLLRDKYVLVLKSRQIGISTIIKAFSVWLCVFYENVVIGIISKDAPEATDFTRDIIGMIEKLPAWMKPQFDKKTERTFILSNGSKCYTSPVNPNAPEKTLRGKSVTFLIVDEAAFIRHIDIAWTSMVPTLSTNQMHARKSGVPHGTILLSTPNRAVGVGSWFFKRYTRSISGESDSFTPVIIHWKDIKELANDPYWYKTICDLFDNDQRKIEQELELKFLSTQGSFFDEITSAKIQEANVKPIERFKIFNGEIWKYSSAESEKSYLIGVDTAPEFGVDKSTIEVFDFETLEQVWEYQGKCKVLDFVKVVKLACSTYPGTVIIESNSYGNQVIEEIYNSEYAPMVYKEKRGLNTIVPGLNTNAKTRPLMIDALYSTLTEFPEIVKSQRLGLELIGLISKPSGRIEADIGCHDDLAIATSLCMYVRKYDPPVMTNMGFSHQIDNEFRMIMQDNTEDYMDEISNSSVIKHVKDNIDIMGGFVDVMGFYNRD
jgi:hypothetical protein